jgi:hypothetical protein
MLMKRPAATGVACPMSHVHFVQNGQFEIGGISALPWRILATQFASV